MRFVRAVVLLVLIALLGGTATGLAQPPTNPGDAELDRSRDQVTAQAGEVATLTTALAELDARTEELQIELAVRREDAEAALVVLETAQEEARAATRRAEDSRIEIEAADGAVEAARTRLDDFLTATYQEGLDAGPLGLLAAATSPEELIARAEFTDVILREQTAAQDGLERARVDKANADSRARAARDESTEREQDAAAARILADDAFAEADGAAREQTDLVAGMDAERAGVQQRLDELTAADVGLREQRDRFLEWEQEQARTQAEQDQAAQAAASARLGTDDTPARGGVRTVIDRALSQLGVQYVWGGGNGRGPSTGIPDAFGSPLDRIGFDCSGLMLFAFNGAGVSLPRVSRNQFNAGRQVPVSELQPGDMIFYRKGSAPIHHVALFIGDGQMVEAPYTGANVRVVPLRTQNLVPQATRVM